MALVLVVEDDPTMAEMVSYNLRRQGLDVDVARDGPSGLRRARSQDVSIVLLDVMLPNLDGVQVAEQLRASRPTLPILMLTARGEEDVKLRGFAAGADDYLIKPFSMDELVLRVKALVRRSRAEAIRSETPPEIRFGDLRLVARDFRCWIDDQEVSVAQGIKTGQLPVNFYFDKSTGLLKRVVRWNQTAVGPVPTQTDYEDYRDVSGIKMPFRTIITWTDGKSTLELKEVRPNVSIEAARFAKPAPARARR